MTSTYSALHLCLLLFQLYALSLITIFEFNGHFDPRRKQLTITSLRAQAPGGGTRESTEYRLNIVIIIYHDTVDKELIITTWGIKS